MEAFEQLFGPVREEFEQKFSKNSNARGLPGGGCWRFDLAGTLRHNCDPIVTKVQRGYSALQMYFWEALKLLFANWRFSCKLVISESKASFTGKESPDSSSRQNGEHEPIKTVLYIHWNVLCRRTLCSVLALILRQDVERTNRTYRVNFLLLAYCLRLFSSLPKFATWHNIFESFSWQFLRLSSKKLLEILFGNALIIPPLSNMKLPALPVWNLDWFLFVYKFYSLK